MIRTDTKWMFVQTQDVRAGADRLPDLVINPVGQASPHHGYLFANARATQLKLVVHDGFGVWCPPKYC